MRDKDLVEGEWGEFVFKIVTLKDHPLILEFLRKYWYPDDLASKYAGVDEEFIKDFENFCKVTAFSEDMSFIAWHKPSQEIASIRLSSTRKQDQDLKLDRTSKGGRNVKKFFGKLDSEANVFERYAINEYAELDVACTATKYRGIGLASEMYLRSIALFKSRGYSMCKSIFTSPYTRKAAAKLGFVEVARQYFSDYRDENGEKAFKEAGEEEFTTIMCLEL